MIHTQYEFQSSILHNHKIVKLKPGIIHVIKYLFLEVSVISKVNTSQVAIKVLSITGLLQY